MASAPITQMRFDSPRITTIRMVVNLPADVKAKYDNLRQILETSVELQRRNQEETAFRFRLTADGDLVPGSVTTLRRRLVTAPS